MNEANNLDPTNPEAEAVESPMPQVIQSDEAIRASTQEPAMGYATPAARQHTGWRSRLGLGAAALGLLTAGAVGGFALTHAVGDGDRPRHEQFGERQGGDFHPEGEHGPGHILPGQLPPAQDDDR